MSRDADGDGDENRLKGEGSCALLAAITLPPRIEMTAIYAWFPPVTRIYSNTAHCLCMSRCTQAKFGNVFGDEGLDEKKKGATRGSWTTQLL
jgi:hypothetical protein